MERPLRVDSNTSGVDDEEDELGLSSFSRLSSSLTLSRFSSSASRPRSLPSIVPGIPAVGSAEAGTAGGLGCFPLRGAYIRDASADR